LKYLISIVTINLNNLTGLKKTVQSVLLQNYSRIEYLIIDGGSTDGSVEFIESNENNLSYWCSEKDEGIYDAMNKGIICAKGDYVLFLNSGDYFYDSKSLSYLVNNSNNEGIIYGKMGMYVNESLQSKAYPCKLSLAYFRYDTIPHQSAIIKRELFDKFGYYKTHFTIVSDWAFFVDCIIKGKVKYKYIDQVISIFDLNGVSSQPSSNQIIRKEINQHLKQKYWFSYQYFKLNWAIKYYPKRVLMEFGFNYE
jgi:glycosyltransferase involved in cell wall biosynthesis